MKLITRVVILSHGRTESPPWNSVHVWPMSVHCTTKCPNPRTHGQHNSSFLLLREVLKFKFSLLAFQAGKGWKCCLFSWFHSWPFWGIFISSGFPMNVILLWLWHIITCLSQWGAEGFFWNWEQHCNSSCNRKATDCSETEVIWEHIKAMGKILNCKK